MILLSVADRVQTEMSGVNVSVIMFSNGCSDQAYVGGENGQRGC